MQLRDGAIFIGRAQSSLAGFCVGLSISLPILLAEIFPLSLLPQFFTLELIVTLPIVGFFIGLALGVILRIVCDIIVGLDFKKRRRMLIAG